MHKTKISTFPTVILMDADDSSKQGIDFPQGRRFQSAQVDFPDGRRFVIEFRTIDDLPCLIIGLTPDQELEVTSEGHPYLDASEIIGSALVVKSVELKPKV